MSVIRIKKAARTPYVIVDTTALNDARLSYRAKGLHTYLMSKPDDWSVYIEHLASQSPTEGREAIATALKELEICGYIHRTKKRGEKGRMAGWETTVYETPALAATARPPVGPEMGLVEAQPKSAQPKSAQPKSANPQLLNKDLTQCLKKTNNPPLSPQGGTHMKKPAKFSMPETVEEQEALRASIFDEAFEVWRQKQYPAVDPLEQWHYFVRQCLSRGYVYAKFRQAFQNAFAWENSPAQKPTRMAPRSPGIPADVRISDKGLYNLASTQEALRMLGVPDDGPAGDESLFPGPRPGR